MPYGRVPAFFPCQARQRTWPAARRRPARWFSLVVFFALGAAFLQVFLHDGFFAGLEPEDAAEGINIFGGDRLENNALTIFDEIDACAGLDPEPAPDA